MADPFAHVRPGDEFNFSAQTWNHVLDAAKAHHLRGSRGGAIPGDVVRDAAIVRVKNETGGALDRNKVVGLGAPIFTPDDDLDAFLREVTFRGVTPASGDEGRFAVLLEPAPADQVVRAYVAGVCPVQVDVTSAAHEFAEVAAGNTDSLVSAETGSAQILWSEGGTGVQWCIVLIGTICGAGPYA